jgi:hypothetical protein
MPGAKQRVSPQASKVVLISTHNYHRLGRRDVGPTSSAFRRGSLFGYSLIVLLLVAIQVTARRGRRLLRDYGRS